MDGIQKHQQRPYLIVSGDEIHSSHLYLTDARTKARETVKAAPGARVRIFKGEESIFSTVEVHDDLPKATEEK